jgi:hypothetical protein
MRLNKTIIENAKKFTRLKRRWSTLPESMVLSIMNNSEVDEVVLNKVRSIKLNNYIKEERRKHG